MIKPNYVRMVFDATDVNASSSLYSVGIPAITSVSGFVDRLHHDLKRIGRRLDIRGFAMGYKNPKFVGHETKYKVALSVPRNTLDPDDIAPSTSPRIAAKFQIVLELGTGDVEAQMSSLREAIEANPGLRFCGGRIDNRGISLKAVEDFSDLWSSYLIRDVSHEIAAYRAQDPRVTLLEAMFILCHKPHEDGLRRYPNTLGFVSLQDAPKVRETPYGSQLHVYAEPAAGIVQEIHTARLLENKSSFNEVFPSFVFRKVYDERGSLYLKQSQPFFS